MTSSAEYDKPDLPDNHGQFGGEVSTKAFIPMRVTQPVTVKPVVPRRSLSRPARTRPNKDLPHKPA